MLMRDHPLAVNLAVANSRSPPHIKFPSIRFRSANPVEAVTECHVVARIDAQVANLVDPVAKSSDWGCTLRVLLLFL
jgi:hypothetical protein